MKPYFATARTFGGEKVSSKYHETSDQARDELMGQAFVNTHTIHVWRLTF